jgi:hypothetical protein
VHQAQAILQAPAEQLAIAGRQQKSAAWEVRSRTGQRLQTLVSLGDRMGKERNTGGVGGDLPEMLDNARRPGPRY